MGTLAALASSSSTELLDRRLRPVPLVVAPSDGPVSAVSSRERSTSQLSGRISASESRIRTPVSAPLAGATTQHQRRNSSLRGERFAGFGKADAVWTYLSTRK